MLVYIRKLKVDEGDIMDIKQMEYLIKIHERGNLTESAEELFVSPQALSKMIHNLEIEFQEQILIRNGNRFVFSEFGKALVNEARIMVSQYNLFSSNLQKFKVSSKTILHLNMATNSTLFLGYNIFNKFNTNSSNYVLSISEYNDYEVDRRLYEDQCDIAFVVNQPEHAELYNLYPIRRHTIGFILSKNHPLANKEVLSIDDISSYPLLARNEHFKTFHDLEQVTRGYNVSLTYALKTSDDNQWPSLVRDNHTIAVALNIENVYDHILFKPFIEEISWTLSLAVKKSKSNEPKIKEFIDYFLTEIK